MVNSKVAKAPKVFRSSGTGLPSVIAPNLGVVPMFSNVRTMSSSHRSSENSLLVLTADAKTGHRAQPPGNLLMGRTISAIAATKARKTEVRPYG